MHALYRTEELNKIFIVFISYLKYVLSYFLYFSSFSYGDILKFSALRELLIINIVCDKTKKNEFESKNTLSRSIYRWKH